ncbi:type II toxin-antitoxin system PemK/MazF family toxin [Bacillus thuringiensis]|nr:type II toxin-antitoxin system PemK/MazF family toxin [Bacillus thuringiensis]
MKNKRGEIWFLELNGKKRPVVIISNDNIVVELDRV